MYETVLEIIESRQLFPVIAVIIECDMYTMLRHTMESFVELWSNTNEDKSYIL